MNMKTRDLPICVFHKGCLDGVGALWVVDKYFKGQVMHLPGVYSNEINMDVFKDKDVYFVDFCYKREDMLKIQAIAKSLTVLDHHLTAEKEVGDLFTINQKRSGTMLAWDHFFPGEEPPLELLLIEDRDLWKFNYPKTKYFTAFMLSGEISFNALNDYFENGDFKFACLVGNYLYDKHMTSVNNLAKHDCRRMKILGYNVPVVNTSGEFASELGNLLSKGEFFAASYQDTVEGRKFSLRSQKEGLNVASIAELFGGGGHAQAAGFLLPYDHAQYLKSHERLNHPQLNWFQKLREVLWKFV